MFIGNSLTHTLTHTGKCPYGTSGTRSAKEDAEREGKGLKMPLHRHLKGFGTLRNQQVARSSRVTSSRKKMLTGLEALSFWNSGLCNPCKTRTFGRFSALLGHDRNMRLSHKHPLLFY